MILIILIPFVAMVALAVWMIIWSSAEFKEWDKDKRK
jgi:hypothetical protein